LTLYLGDSLDTGEPAAQVSVSCSVPEGLPLRCASPGDARGRRGRAAISITAARKVAAERLFAFIFITHVFSQIPVAAPGQP